MIKIIKFIKSFKRCFRKSYNDARFSLSLKEVRRLIKFYGGKMRLNEKDGSITYYKYFPYPTTATKGTGSTYEYYIGG